MGKQEVSTNNPRPPAEIIAAAITGGADLEKLKGLLDLQKEWEANEARKAFHQAMADFKKDPPKINKDRHVNFSSKQGGRVSYNHASLGNVVEKINTALSKCGLSASWTTKQDGSVTVTCKITHAMGHSEETSLSAPPDETGLKNPIQQVASTVSYLQRYTILSLTGLATDDMDNDGQAVSVEVIDKEEIEEITKLLNGASASKILKFAKVSLVSDIKKEDYLKIITILKAKVKK